MPHPHPARPEAGSTPRRSSTAPHRDARPGAAPASGCETGPAAGPGQPGRRRLLAGGLALAGAPWLAGCGTPLPLPAGAAAGGTASAEATGPGGSAPGQALRDAAPEPRAAARLRETAQAHGWAAYRGLHDIAVGYDGQWRPLIDRIQPRVIDKAFRGRSQERLLPHLGVVAQDYSGPGGRKLVHWRRAAPADPGAPANPASPATPGTGPAGAVAVWFNGQRSADAAALEAAALVAEGYGLFLLGPLWVLGRVAPPPAAAAVPDGARPPTDPGADAALDAALRRLDLRSEGTERVDGRLCDVVTLTLRPGLGLSALDRVALAIDRDDATTRRVRFTLEGVETTRGAVAQVDRFEHRRLHGVLWPMRSYEEVVHPLRLPAHDWYITGLDVNRGLDAQALEGPAFSGRAAAPARAPG